MVGSRNQSTDFTDSTDTKEKAAALPQFFAGILSVPSVKSVV
jgi:hypothetical protein